MICRLLRDSDENVRKKAFGEMVRNFSPRIYWQIRRLVFSHDDANDIMQETFIKVWTSLSSFRGDSSLFTWVYRIAVNEALTFLRKKKNNVSIDSPEADYVRELPTDAYFDGDEAQIRFQKAISTLPDKQRLVFNMRYFDEMKYEDISEILNTSVGALKASYHHAVKKIEAFFAEHD